LPLRFDHGIAAVEWPPLVDGTYAIVMTLMVIELPDVAINLLKDLNEDKASTVVIIAQLINLLLGYLTVFLVAFGAQRVHRHLLRLKRLEEPAEQQAESLQTRLIALASLQRDALFRIVLIPLIVLPCTAIGLPAPLPVLLTP